MIEWDDSLDTGDALVDRQHRRIHQVFADLENAEDTPDEIMRVLDTLTDYVAAHFATEEDLMVRAGFSGERAELHRTEHARLTDRTREHVLSFRDGTLTTTAPLTEFLREWLCDHIGKCDRVLIDHVREHGFAAREVESPA